MTLTLDLSTIITSLITSLIIALVALVAKQNRILNKLVDQIGTTHPPEGILGRVSKSEAELFDLREWAIRQGYDRRTHTPPVVNG